MYRLTYTLFLFLIAAACLTAQQGLTLHGRVTVGSEPLPLASLVLRDPTGEEIIAFAYTNNEGAYRMAVDTTGRFELIASAMGYGADTSYVTLGETAVVRDFNLTATAFEFREITVKANRVIREQKDTVIIDAQSFAQGDEEVVEDLLRRIPGLKVADDGAISVDGQEVDRVLIEGDDMFERGYQVLTKNLPSYPIKNVEILRNYSRNRLLKGIEDRQRVAINLTLQEQYRRVWSGNAYAGYGAVPTDRYTGQVNLMNFGKKNKYYFLGAANNTGASTVGNIQYLLHPRRQGEPDEIGADVDNLNLIPFAARAPNFDASRSLLNNDELLSLNSVLSPTEKLKIKLMAFGNADENYFREAGVTTLLPPGQAPTTLRDSSYASRAPLTLGGRLEATYQLATNADLRYTGYLSRETEDARQRSVFNGLQRRVNLAREGSNTDHHLNLTQRLSDKSVLSTSLALINRLHSTRVRAQNSFLFGAAPGSFTQDVNTQLQYHGMSSHYLHKTARGHTLEGRVSYAERRDDVPVSLPEAREARQPFEYELRELLADLQYKHKIGRFRLVGQLQGGKRRLSLRDLGDTEKITPWVLNPTAGFEYLDGQQHRLNVLVMHTQNPTTSDQSLSTPLAYDFRRLQLGTATPLNLESTSLGLRYQRGSWSDRFFFFTFTATAAQDHDYLTSRRTIGQEIELTQWYRATDRQRLQTRLETNYFLKKWRVNLRGEFSVNYANLKDQLNGQQRDLEQLQLRQQWSFRTASVGKLNVGAGYGNSQNSVRTALRRSTSEQHSFIDLTYQMSKRFLLTGRADNYFFTVEENRSQQFFLDLELRYTPREQRFAYSLRARNLFGGGEYRNFSVNDFSLAERRYALQPAYVMARMEWRFR